MAPSTPTRNTWVTVYPIDSRGHIGIQIRMMSRLDRDSRPESQQSARIELETTYEPISQFSRSLIALLLGDADEAVLAGEV